MSELRVQRQIIEAVRFHGGVAFKQSNRFLAGLPDLFIKLPGLQAAMVEVKWSPKINRLRRVGVNLTPLQRKYLRDLRQVSMNAFWIVVGKQSLDTWMVLCGNDPDAVGAPGAELQVVKRIATTDPLTWMWPLRDIRYG